MAYEVTLKKRVKVKGAICLAGTKVKVSDELFEELDRRNLVSAFEEVADEPVNKLPDYEKITEAQIREKLDELNVDHSEAKDKRAAYDLLVAQGGE